MDLLAEFLTKRRAARRKLKASEVLARFKAAKGRAPASMAEMLTFLIKELKKGKLT
jgi:hypothetical protein